MKKRFVVKIWDCKGESKILSTGKKEYFANSAGDALFQLQEETSHLKKTHDVKPATANITELERQKACMVFIFVEFYETKFEILKRELYASSDLFINKLIC